MCDGDARYGRSSDVVVGDEEGISDGTEHPNLMANVGQIRACGWLDFTKDLEFPDHPLYATWIWRGSTGRQDLIGPLATRPTTAAGRGLRGTAARLDGTRRFIFGEPPG